MSEQKRIYLSPPHMGGNELKYIQEAFETNWIAPLGPNVDNFERVLSSYLNVTDTAAVTSGTAALHLALIMLGVEQGDEVIVSSFTFSGSVNPIIYQKAIPVFVDSEDVTWNMDPDLLEKAIKDRLKKGKKPKAIIVVHLYGMPAQLDKIMDIAQRYEIPVIEDAAEALGSKFNGQYCGTFGVMGILSFNGNKIITTSGGGALIANDKKYTDKARFLSTQARDKAPYYQHSQIGYNYRMSNIVAGIGLGQMEVLDLRIKQKREIHQWYRQIFEGKPGITFLTEPDERYFSNYWLTTIIIDSQEAGFSNEDLRLALEEKNIESRPLWKPMHLQPVFRNHPAYLNGVSESLFSKGLCLPSATSMTDNDKQRILSVIERFI